MTATIIIATCISAFAATAIAIYAGKSHTLANKNYQLAQEIKKANELRTESDMEFRQQLSDLYKAIVISNLMIDRIKDTYVDANITNFTNIYQKRAKGKTTIFEEGG